MSFSAKILGCGLLLLLAGCATNERRSRVRPPDWEDAQDGAVFQVPPAPLIAPPPAVAPGPATPRPPAVRESHPEGTKAAWVSLEGWARQNKLAFFSAGGAPPGYLVKSTNGLLSFRVGSRNMQFSGTEVRSGFAPQLIGSQPYVQEVDVRKTFQPLLLGTSGRLQQDPRVIVLDPGHGGQDAGTTSVLGGHYEKEFTLDWALRLRRILATNGFTVFLTRTNDVDASISERVAFAQQHQATLFLSLHFNSAAPNEVESGLETYCLTPAGMPSTLTRGYGDDSTQAFPNNDYDEQNLQLAQQIHEALLRVNGHLDRGVRRARFPGILRGQHCPAVLIEGGYLSNPTEARWIADPAYREKLAEAVASAVRKVN